MGEFLMLEKIAPFARSNFLTGANISRDRQADWLANIDSSEACGFYRFRIEDKLNKSRAVNVHKLLTIQYTRPACTGCSAAAV